MNTWSKYILTAVGVAYFVGCSPVKFEKDSAFGGCQTGPDLTCSTVHTESGSFNDYEQVFTADSEAADVLFVVDNSASMYRIQENIGSKFSSFFDSIKDYNFHIGITTTDISSSENAAREINKNGLLQDGNLIPFGDGSLFLTKSTTNAKDMFLETIKRDETKKCENFIYANCDLTPNGKGCGNVSYSLYQENCASQLTRGITAAAMAVQKNQAGFLRAKVPLSVIIISNSDENTRGETDGPYALKENDQPQYLADQIKQLYKDESAKDLKVHSIIVRPGDMACLSDPQKTDIIEGVIYGFEGKKYQEASSLSGGTVGDICSDDYAHELGTIASAVLDQLGTLTLVCQPADGTAEVTYADGKKETLNVTNLTIQLASPITPKQSVRVKYKCRSNG